MPGHQSEFRAALLNPNAPIPPGLRDGKGQPAGKRFSVYRNNVTVALIEALRAGFPVICKLLGQENFDQLARLFAREHPPKSPLMMHYGADIPAFLEAFEPLAHIPYLADVARLELALRRSYHAADTPIFEAASLGAVAPEALMESTLILAAPVEFIDSRWPLVDIWRFNTVADADKPRAMAQPTLITRAAFDPLPHALTTDQASWVKCVLTGATLGAAQDTACAKNPEFDLASLLGLLIQTNAIADLKTPKETSQ